LSVIAKSAQHISNKSYFLDSVIGYSYIVFFRLRRRNENSGSVAVEEKTGYDNFAIVSPGNFSLLLFLFCLEVF
jgi:hypothetical protein